MRHCLFFKKYEITNIVCSGSVQTTLDLTKLARENPDVKYQPHKCSAAVWRHKQIHGTLMLLMLFSNGKFNYAGEPHKHSLKTYIRQYVNILSGQDYAVRLSDIRVVNMSAAAVHKLGGKINLNTIPGGQYEPEIFNASFLKRQSCTYCIFHTGTVVMTGIRNIDDVYHVLLELELLSSM